jgi:hypothetical protein
MHTLVSLKLDLIGTVRFGDNLVAEADLWQALRGHSHSQRHLDTEP